MEAVSQISYLRSEELPKSVSQATETYRGEKVDGEASVEWVIPWQQALE